MSFAKSTNCITDPARLGPIGTGYVRSGMAAPASFGPIGSVGAWWGKADNAGHCGVSYGVVRRGSNGEAKRSTISFRNAGHGWPGSIWSGFARTARNGLKWQAGLGLAPRGLSRLHRVTQGLADQIRLGSGCTIRCVSASSAGACNDRTWQASQRLASCRKIRRYIAGNE